MRSIFFILFSFLIINSSTAAQAEFYTSAKQVALIDFATGTSLYSKNAHERMGPSSMTKIMTTYIIFDSISSGHFNFSSEFLVSEKAWKKGGSKMFLEVGKYVNLEDLIKGIVVQSGNDACIVFAEGYAGSEEAFANIMNKYAKKLGMNNTNFVNATGWPDDNHYSTAYDLAILAKRIIQDYPEFYHYFSIKDFKYHGITQNNRNDLLHSPASGVDGLKTGHTENAGYGIVTSAKRGETRLISVVNGLNSSKERIQETEKLLNYGFHSFKKLKLFDKNTTIDNVKLHKGSKDFVPVALKDDVFIIAENDKNIEDYYFEVVYNEPWTAPIAKDTHIATLIISQLNNGEKEAIIQYPLYSMVEVSEAGTIKQILNKLKYLVNTVK